MRSFRFEHSVAPTRRRRARRSFMLNLTINGGPRMRDAVREVQWQLG
ncbi:Hypothetical protein CAP_1935 [Chondromyces apiculatus DSM 436]|uniref:Uncharacterized protein n=1 Tax=Chondromyces apiculatus DSM 436 TaxID=1192034 RepID=A0A017TC71_9BACT|nr:Hypothetical protein CAP_1935 [Chondromyces apiculatus DSM 436]